MLTTEPPNSCSKHWMQNNLDRLALTFGRPILGVHNKTYESRAPFVPFVPFVTKMEFIMF